MIGPGYFLIQGKDNLGSDLAALDEELASLVSEPHLWIKTVGGRTTKMSVHHLAEVKVSFVRYIQHMYAESDGGDALKLIPATTEGFDRLWACAELVATVVNHEDAIAMVGGQDPVEGKGPDPE